MVRRLLEIWHMYTSKYGQKYARNAAPTHRSELEEVSPEVDTLHQLVL